MERTCKKLKDVVSAKQLVERWKREKKTVVFTNGCFDILHLGHVRYLEEARGLGDKLVVGLNTDNSIRRIKGRGRPIQDQQGRALVLAALQFVDLVVFFDDDNPLSLVSDLLPHILVKGSDYLADEIVGAEIVRRNGGEVKTLDLVSGYSTSAIMDRIRKM